MKKYLLQFLFITFFCNNNFSQNILGIDVSAIQGTINWSQVASEGKSFAFVKATKGICYTDSKFYTNMANGNSAGVKLGAYHFALPEDNSAVSEANYFVNVASAYIGAGYLPPVLDLEDPAGTCLNNTLALSNFFSSSALTAWVQTFMTTVQNATGVKPILYTSSSIASYLNSSLNGYKLWIANPGTSSSTPPTNIGNWSTWAFKQYSWTGTVAGINPVDLDVFNGTLTDFNNLINGSSSSTPPNDNCANAITLTSNTSCSNTSGTLNGATVDGFPTQPTCDVFGSSASQKGVFYKFTATSNSHTITVTPTGSGSTAVDAVVTVYTGSSCNSLNQFDCFGGTGGAGGTQKSKTITGLTIGNTYWIRIYDYGSVDPALPDFQICVTHQNTSTCSAPTVFPASNITQNSALITWNSVPNALSYTLRYRTGTTSWTAINNITSTSQTISPLLCNATYEWQVDAICSNGSNTAIGTSFTTSTCTNGCVNTVSERTLNAPTCANGTLTIYTSQWQDEYNTINNVVGGTSYISSYSLGGWITVRYGTTNGTVVGQGSSPLTWNASQGSGTYYVHYNTNSSCGTARNSGTSTIAVANCITCTSPSSFQVTAFQTSASFTWTNGNTNSYRRIWYKKTTDATFTQTPIISSSATSYQVTGLTCNTNYQCFLYDSCSNGTIYTIPQPDLFFTTSTCPVTCATPTTLQVTPSQTSASFTWVNGTTNSYRRIWYKKTTDALFTQTPIISSSATSYQVTGLTCNTNYQCFLYDSCSNGTIYTIPQPDLFFTTTACPTCTTTPSAPNSLTTGYPSSNTIGLSWSGSIVGFNNFDVERATSVSGPFNHIAYVAPPTTNYNDTNIVAGTTYYYRVRACCDNNCSAYSNIGSATACVWRNRATSVSISNDTICLGNSVILTAIGGNLGTGDVWTWYLNGGFPIGTGSPITFTPTTSGTYCVKPDGGCVNQPNVSVTCKDFTVTNCVITCNSISNGSTSNITSNSATINWNKDLSVATNNLIIEYKPFTSSTWSSNTLSNNAITTILNSLGCSVNYQYRVIATCTNSLKDTVAGTFTTLTCPTNICDTLPKINVIPATCNLYTSNISGVSYQWQSNGNNVGTNSRFYTASGGNTIYTVTISNGTQTCTSPDYIFNCTITGVQNNVLTDSYSIFPNPTKNSVFIQSKSNSNLKISISLTNIIGQEVQQKVITNTNQFELSLKNLPVGIYILNISDDKGNGSMKIIKE